MISVQPITLEHHGVRLEPLDHGHADGLRAAACDGELWKLRVTSVPAPEDVAAWIAAALEMRPARLAFAVVDAATGTVIGSTSYHDIVPAIGRLEIGYTWYAKSRQRSHVNTSCKLLLAEDIPPEALRSKDSKAIVPPLHGALLKNEQDVHLFERLVFMSRTNR